MEWARDNHQKKCKEATKPKENKYGKN